jgi:hypothetical protein
MHLPAQIWTVVGLAGAWPWMACAQAQQVALPAPTLFAGEGTRELKLIEEEAGVGRRPRPQEGFVQSLFH